MPGGKREGARTGILGGTFDPIHCGHLVIAGEVQSRLGLDEVVFIPAGQPWLKSDIAVTSGVHRLRMLMLAVEGLPGFVVSTIEIDRSGPSYSVDTVSALAAERGREVDLYFILGIDALAELPLWKEPGRMVEMCRLVGVSRPGWESFDPSSLEEALPGISSRLIILDLPLADVSSTDIRRRVSAGLSIRDLVPGEVEDYIIEHGLYRGI
ncbi:nicotinate-nucleotide adenylyltransferase [Chloroflexota bacterium]